MDNAKPADRSRSSWSSGMPRTANTEIPSSGTPSSAQNSAVRAASWPRVPVVSGPPRMTNTSPPGGSSGRRRVAISLRSRIDPLAFECSRRPASQLADRRNDLFCGKPSETVTVGLCLSQCSLAHPRGDMPGTGNVLCIRANQRPGVSAAIVRSCRAAHMRRGRAQAFYDRGGSCWSAHVLPSGSLKVTNEPHG
jgi:hypothetical protein